MPEPTSSRRPLSDLTGALDGARPRRAEDATDPDIPIAATVVLLRDGGEGLEVLMIERPDRGSFAGAWVFPGGKLEPVDRLSPDESEEDVARRAGVRETREETGLEIDPASLGTLSCWDPPPGLALRIRTWFFVGAGSSADLVLAPDEVVASRWMRPDDALAAHGRGELTLYPPTWVTLHGLAQHPDTASALGAARVAGVDRFETVARRGGESAMLLWRGDADYDGAGGDAASTARHRLEIDALPWRYERTA